MDRADKQATSLPDSSSIQSLLMSLRDEGLPWEQDAAGLRALPGPHKLKARYPTKEAALTDFISHNRKGKNIVFLEKLAKEFGGDTAINMTVPTVIFVKVPFVTDIVVVADPRDAERVARLHVKKSLIYGDLSNFLGDGVLSTRNVESWHEQRQNLAEGFLPLSALSKVMPVSVNRANFAVQSRLAGLANGPFDICEFYLFEAMTQLHLALLGESTEFSEANNTELRKNFSRILLGAAAGRKEWKASRDAVREFSKQVLDHTKNDRGDPTRCAPFRATQIGCPVIGPVAAKLAENTPNSALDPVSAQRDSVTTISFAGFDTTALNMTWVTFEMCRHPDLQRRLQEEIDEVYDSLGGRDLQYEDLGRFTFLTKVINETLRLWTSVPNGTFREIQYPESVHGLSNEMVELPPGTQVWIPSWLLHRSEALWGKDVLKFNPDREWLPEESWFGKSFGATNPASYRFAPFTFPPRGCLGLNFAQMESRVILSKVFRQFDLELAEPTKGKSVNAHIPETFLGENRGTMQPEGGLWVRATPRVHRKRSQL